MQHDLLFPSLTTARLILRQLEPEDAPAYFDLRMNDEVGRYLDRPKPESLDAIYERIEFLNELIRNKESLFWAISLKSDSHLIGTICFWNYDLENNGAELGYELHPDSQRKGYMQEAAAAAIRYGFEQMKFGYIKAWTSRDNTASIRLLEKNHFRRDLHAEEKIDRSTDRMNSVI